VHLQAQSSGSGSDARVHERAGAVPAAFVGAALPAGASVWVLATPLLGLRALPTA
jgi:hypothetical protein